MNAMPARIESMRASACAAVAPAISIDPELGTSAPAIARTISVRPAPTSPARPTISPAAHVESYIVDHAADAANF